MHAISIHAVVLIVSQIAPPQTPTSEPSPPPSSRNGAVKLLDLKNPETQEATETDSSQTKPADIPASTEQPGGTPTESVHDTSTHALMSSALHPPLVPEWLSDAKRFSLHAVLEKATSRDKQQAAIHAYWHLSLAEADLHHAANESEFLRRFSLVAAVADAKSVRAAQEAADARRVEAKLALVAAQHELVEVASLPATDSLPLTVDEPLVGAYRTEFNTLFAGRPVPLRLRKINDIVPIMNELLQRRAVAVAAARDLLDERESAYKEAAVGIHAVLSAHIQLRDQRIAFLAAVRDYNLAIAEYALAVASRSATSDALVGMLIKSRPASGDAPITDTQVRPASAEQPVISPSQPLPVAPPAPLVPVEPVPRGFVPRSPDR